MGKGYECSTVQSCQRAPSPASPNSRCEEDNMARRLSSSQARAAIRRAQAQQKQAINKYNRDAKAHNAKVKSAVNAHNRDVGKYNNAVRSENARRRQAVNRYNQAVREYNRKPAQIRTTSTTAHIGSVRNLQESFTRLEASESGRAYPGLVDLGEREATNSAEAFSALLSPVDPEEIELAAELERLQATTITSELRSFSADLDDRWNGALFALNPKNPDAARHFCASARETVGSLLEVAAPDDAVKSANPNYFKTPRGDISRRARIHYCLASDGEAPAEVVDFVEADIDNLIDLFDDFNSGTHGASGRFPLHELIALKNRVEDAIKFVFQLTQT